MKLLLRKIQAKSHDREEHRDATLVAEEITLGRATDQLIYLPDKKVQLKHARIIFSESGELHIKSRSLAGMLVNGHPLHAAKLEVGDRVQIGDNLITVIQEPDDHDAALSLQLGFFKSGEKPSYPYKMRLSQTTLTKRRWSWIGFFGILAVFLLVPLWGYVDPAVRIFVRDVSILPDDSVWDTGQLHSAHSFIGKDCNACHKKPFIMVENETCLGCHADTRHHFDVEQLMIDDWDDERCASCHKEHNEPSSLVRTDEKMCSDCHGQLAEITKEKTQLERVTDFAFDHPNFKVSFFEPASMNPILWEIKRESLMNPNIIERSQLKFPHKTHLSMEGVEGPNGIEVLSCNSCHQLDAGGKLFKPIRMEKHCESCHQLNFDEHDPTRKVPHGKPELVLQKMQEYFSLAYLENQLSNTPDVQARSARRPGQPTQAERQEAYDWAQKQSYHAAVDLFEKRVCEQCHDVERKTMNPPSWHVAPVKLTKNWMPKALFVHDKHDSMQCSDCHKALDSEVSADVLMPNIDTCRECHGGETTNHKIQSTCIDCHAFHLDDTPAMK